MICIQVFCRCFAFNISLASADRKVIIPTVIEELDNAIYCIPSIIVHAEHHYCRTNHSESVATVFPLLALGIPIIKSN